MKPSERIKEIFNSKGKAFSSERIIARSLDAVIQYLDEEYERNKPKESKGCKKCGFSTEIGSDGKCWSSVCKGK